MKNNPPTDPANAQHRLSLTYMEPVPDAPFKLRHLVQIHDRETFAHIEESWSKLHVLYVITAGQARLIGADGKLTLTAGSAFIRRSGCLLQHDSYRGSLSPVQGIAIAFDFTDQQHRFWPFGSRAPVSSHLIVDKAADLAKVCAKGHNSSSFRVHILFYELLGMLQDQVATAPQPDHSWLDGALRHIHKMYAYPLTREQMAKASNVSPEHFSREFKRYTGLTFVEYVSRLRIRMAQEHLLLGSPTLQELARLTGYKDSFYLSRKFKQIVGAAPTHYRHTPKKIVSLTYNYTASLLALGCIPHMGAVASWMESGLDEHVRHQMSQYAEHELLAHPQLIAEVNPDIIIGYAPHPALDELRMIAPTILMPFEEVDWQQQFIQIGRMAGLESKAQAIIHHYHQLEQDANEILDNLIGEHRGSAVCLFLNGEQGAYVFGHSWGRASHILYESLGFKPPTRMLKDGRLPNGYIHVPLSDIHLYAADYIFVAYPEEAAEQQAVISRMNEESWSTLAAIRNGCIYEIEADMFYGFDPLSMMKQLKHIMHHFTSHLSML
ncbi:ABC-type Fe3+-hydroxamate transport system substrate-binding protein [Paenibacillus sp. JGP012]|uniref:helix-turn-helix domain-containing protein n=1 Tax=Paenibacillus sp. JGP012 TaxID=2735914 RepID=UPI00161CBDC3|nr:helix-turn-helix domain-containing protein [Paenibacillus sp. JGP012]MBB6019921.1 ABC-type Fe3+-hydroxamate transport system substrate-binding protein [Paenibacillus sp. JGP012]